MKEYGFSIGDRSYLIEGEDEKEALYKLIEMKWELINDKACILLHGEVVEKKKVNSFEEEDLDEDWEEEE